MDMLVEATDPKKQAQLVRELTGPLRTVGTKVDPADVGAPAWWHGEEEAYEAAQLAMTMRRRRRRR